MGTLSPVVRLGSGALVVTVADREMISSADLLGV
jgi:hypothetical protein